MYIQEQEMRTRLRVHERTIQILINKGFPVCKPIKAELTCLDLAALKMLPFKLLKNIALLEEKNEKKIEKTEKKNEKIKYFDELKKVMDPKIAEGEVNMS
jgi:hypothetical protein